MFFYRIERLNNADTMKDEITDALKSPKFTVIPLVSPTCAVGEFLMDPEKSADISENTGPKVNIFYIAKEIKAEYSQFMDHILSEVRSISGEDIKEPGFLIFFPQRELMVNIEVAVEDSPRKFRTVIYQLIDALESDDPLKNIAHLRYLIKVTDIADNKPHQIEDVHLYIIKFFSR